MTRLRATATLSVALIATLGLSACAGDPDTTANTATQSLPSKSAGGLTPLGDASMAEKTQRPNVPSQLVVTDVRTGTHQGFDRVVFDFVGVGTPGWFVDYIATPTQQGSGSTVPVDGEAYLSVNIDGTVTPHALGIADPELGHIPGTGSVHEVVNAGSLGERSQFIVGLDKEGPYSVQILDNPMRLVIDIRT